MSQRYFKGNSDITCADSNTIYAELNLMYQSLVVVKKMRDLRIRGALIEPVYARDITDEYIAKMTSPRAAEFVQSQAEPADYSDGYRPSGR